MKTLVEINASGFEFYTAIVTVTFAFVLYTVLTGRNMINRFFPHKPNGDNMSSVIYQRSAGFVLFGIIPMIIVYFIFGKVPESFGFRLPQMNYCFYVVIALVLILPIVTRFNSKSEQNLNCYPQIRNRLWTPGIVVLNACSWALYLFAYEFMFRGFLLSATVNSVGIVYAIAINTGVYSIYHFPKGYKESLGAIPFGIIVCIISYETGSFFYAFLLHLTMAWSNDFYSLKAHPGISTTFSKKV